MQYPVVIFGILLAIARVFVHPHEPTLTDAYKDVAHLFMGGLFVAYCRDRLSWQRWTFWLLAAWEVAIFAFSRSV